MMNTSLKILILLFFMAYAQCILGQEKSIFYTNEDTIFLMTDYSYDVQLNEKKGFIWNFSEANPACYSQINVKPNEDKSSIQFISNEGLSYRFHVKKDQIYLENHFLNDPFYNSGKVSVHYQEGLKIFKKKMNIYDTWDSKTIFEYEIKLREDYKRRFPNATKMKLKGEVTQSSKVEAIHSVSLPYDLRDVTLINNELTYKLTSIEVFMNGKWISQKPQKTYSSNKKKILNYISSEPPYLNCEVILGHDQKSEQLSYLSDRRPSQIQNCSAKRENIYLYPNPGFGDINLRFSNQKRGRYQIAVYNVIGKEILRREIQVDKPNQVIPLDLTELRKGSYLYAIIDPSGKRILTKKLVILSI